MKDLRPTYRDGVPVSSGRVVRRTANPCDHRGRRIVVALEPGDIIAFRKERTRTWFRMPIDTAYLYAVKVTVDNERAIKRQQKKAGRQSAHLR